MSHVTLSCSAGFRLAALAVVDVRYVTLIRVIRRLAAHWSVIVDHRRRLRGGPRLVVVPQRHGAHSHPSTAHCHTPRALAAVARLGSVPWKPTASTRHDTRH